MIQLKKEKKPNMTKEDFAKVAVDLPFVLSDGTAVCNADGEAVSLVAREFASGSVGYGYNGSVIIGGAELYASISLTLKGSKPKE